MTRLKLSLIFYVCLALLGTTIPALATTQNQHNTKPPIQIKVKTHPAQVSAGQEIWGAVEISMDRGWHIYGNPKGPGPGLPTILKATTLPQGIQAAPARFLPAQKIIEEELDPSEWVWAYKDQTVIYMLFSTSNALLPGDYRVGLYLSALLCREGICMPYKTDLMTNLDIVSSPERAGTIPPQVLKDIKRTHTAQSTSTSAMAFVAPSTDKSIDQTTDQLTEIPDVQPRPLHRVLEVSGLLKAVIFSLLAGLILNFTPCVLPVVSLKVLGFVQQAQESGRRVTLMGLSFSAGIVVVFLVLAALASFAGYGWGDLFQKQQFLIAMIGLVFAMSLCLFGIFQLPIPHFATENTGVSAQRHGYMESFYKGTLATFLATPCSGPLLGGAMAWTLRQPPVQIFAVFACLGLGMSFPYVVMSFYPAALRWLPRPGNWVIHFERFMGFALLATVVYLLTILPEDMRIWVVLFCLFLALGLYIWGQMTSLSDSFRRRLAVRMVAVIIVCAGGWLSLEVLPADEVGEEYAVVESERWQPYTDMKLLQGARANRWVVVDFTADWCPNCLLVERTALRNKKVLKTFRNHNVLLLKADLTHENPPAKRLLQKMGSRSIPFLALFPPGEHFWQPFFLRDIYRAGDVLKIFEIATKNDHNT
jgi:thiol:disulfide interchange protein DsbD